MPKIIRFDAGFYPNAFPDSTGADMEGILRDVDDLFRSLGANPEVRRVVHHRMMGLRTRAIAERCQMTVFSVRYSMACARALLASSSVTGQADGDTAGPAAEARPRPHSVWGKAARSDQRASSLRPLSAEQSFGWRDVYYSEVHRYARRR